MQKTLQETSEGKEEAKGARRVYTWRRGKVVRIVARCRYCGSTYGRIIYGSIHVYFQCYKCGEITDLGLKA